jgi:hypothetical protein
MTTLQRLYLDLLRKSICNVIHQKGRDEAPTVAETDAASAALEHVRKLFHEEIRVVRKGQSPRPDLPPEQLDFLRAALCQWSPSDIAQLLRLNSPQAHSLLQPEAFRNIEECICKIHQDGIAGHLIECGVWKGGAAIFMRGCLAALEIPDRCVYLADSFEGLPEPDRQTQLLDAVTHELLKFVGAFRVGLEDVQSNFASYGLLDDRVRFLPGWFEQTLPHFHAPLALVRLDGDWYDSTRVALEHLYPQLSPGGFIIIDDYYPLFGAKQAVDDYRASHQIEAELLQVNVQVHYWRKPL